MQQAIEKELEAANLQVIDVTVKKILQLYETKLTSCSHDSWSDWQREVSHLENTEKYTHSSLERKQRFSVPDCQGKESNLSVCLCIHDQFVYSCQCRSLFLGLPYQPQESIVRGAVWRVQSSLEWSDGILSACNPRYVPVTTLDINTVFKYCVLQYQIYKTSYSFLHCSIP